MSGFFKKLGQGILYVLIFPFFILALAIYAVVGIVIFFISLVRCIIYFFQAKKFDFKLPEDRKAENILLAASRPMQPQTTVTGEPVVVIQNPNINNVVDAEIVPPPSIDHQETNYIEQNEAPQLENFEEIQDLENSVSSDEFKENEEKTDSILNDFMKEDDVSNELENNISNETTKEEDIPFYDQDDKIFYDDNEDDNSNDDDGISYGGWGR